MSKYIIVAETGSDVPKEMAAEYGIYLVPMHVTFGDVMKDDGAFPTQEVCDYYDRTGKAPTTSGCNPEDFVKVFGDIRKEHPDSYIVYLAYSAVTTCSYQSAKIAAEDDEKVLFIDTKQVCIGQASVVIRMAEELKAHPEWTPQQVIEEAEHLSRLAHMSFVPSNLDYLRAGGRVSNATALCGNLLGIHPRIEILDGYLKATKKYRGKMQKVVFKLVADFMEEVKPDKKVLWLGNTPGFPENLKQEVLDKVKEMGFETVYWVNTGGVITTHGGYNAFTICGFRVEEG